MKPTLRRSLSGRLLLVIGLSVVLPLTLLVGSVLLWVYQTNTDRNLEALQQTSQRYTAVFQSRMAEKLGKLETVAALLSTGNDEELAAKLSASDRDLWDVWIRREGAVNPAEDPGRRQLYEAVRAEGAEVLSSPDFEHKRAALGLPLFQAGRFVGMVAMSFPLDFFRTIFDDAPAFSQGYLFVVSHQGFRVTHPDPSLVGVPVGNDLSPDRARNLLAQVRSGRPFTVDKPALINGRWSRLYYNPIAVGKARNSWNLVLVAYLDEANRGLDTLFLVLGVGVLVTLGLVGAATWGSTQSIIRPLRALAQGAEALAAGHLETRVPDQSNDEVGQLARSFNRMADQLAQTLRDQEDMVRRRTESLKQSLEDLEQAQAKIIDSEKLAVLGQLMATLAHEINTPLGAIRSSATFLHQSTSSRFGDLPDFFRSLDPATLAWYRALVVGKGVDLRLQAGTGDRRRRRALAQTLADHGVADPEGLADDIAFLTSADEEHRLVEGALEGRGLAIRMAAQTAAFVQSSAIILEAADRAAATVAALVDYSRREEFVGDGVYDPAREFDTLLTLYYGVSKQGVEVVRDFEPGLTVQGDRDRLNQVWVNLMNNALQAMEYRGRLVLRTRTVDRWAEITVANNGPRIPDNLKEKIFQPFFTTKRAGEGTGLGLDICRRIIEAHHGSLILSEEGELTVFAVRIPLFLTPRSTP